ncbi:hypothetical protein LZ554_004587 [Drepanopeziza brunnea f. sp. 'monogermtubi']|nr:hypothetical protein LZ554_004587 [Drepanopeziza brunnea f. sp. 'monogermtubi']
MQFSVALITSFAALAIAAPIEAPLAKRIGILSTKTYDEISISGGKAGDAEAEAIAALTNNGAIDTNDLSNVDAADIAFWESVNDIGNDAEKGAFNPAIEAATGDEKTALTNGKIKNKVLKLEATILELGAQAAQGEDTAAKMAAEQKKLDNNIALDKKAAGQPSTALTFDASTA